MLALALAKEFGFILFFRVDKKDSHDLKSLTFKLLISEKLILLEDKCMDKKLIKYLKSYV